MDSFLAFRDRRSARNLSEGQRNARGQPNPNSGEFLAIYPTVGKSFFPREM